jgi:hypothetical protein
MMTSLAHGPAYARGRRVVLDQTLWRPLFATIAIVGIWLAVLFVGVFGPDIVSNDGSHVPAVVVVAICAMVATIPVARRGYAQPRSDQ